MQATPRATLAALAVLFAGAASAGPLDRKDVPDPLRPWIGWALHGEEARFCPPAHDDADRRLCSWPSELTLVLDDKGGRFELLAHTDAPGWLQLPGDTAHWPQDLLDGGREAAVLPGSDGPAAWVAPGDHRLQGRFDWPALPESLRVPPRTGLVDLTIGGKPVAHPGRDERSHVWLGKAVAGPAAETAHLDLRVFRMVDDDIPARVTTRIEIDAGGEVREEVIGPVLLPDLVPVSLSGDLPARLEDDGRLRVQVRPGQWSLSLEARSKTPLAQVAVPRLEAPWPAQEVWSFNAHHDLRVVEPTGLSPVDPRQTGTPEEWQALPAFIGEPGSALALEEKQRGDPEPEPDQLHLSRQVWLDFDGDGYTLQDQLTGKLSRTWRLDATAPIALGRVQVDNEPQLITKSGETSGVEVRHGTLNLVADSRIDGGDRRLPATGWNTDLQGVDVTLHLPPAWRLLAAPGADNVPDTWLSRWTLLDLFLVLVASVAALRLFGVPTALLTLVMLAMTWHEPGAPRWTWLNLIAAIALLRAVPPSFGGQRLRMFLSAWRWLSVGALALVAIPYAIDTARNGLYPQLENGAYGGGMAGFGGMADQSMVMNAPPPPPAPMSAPMQEASEVAERVREAPVDAAGAVRREARVYKEYMVASKSAANISQTSIQRLDPNVLTQTGPGLPQWQWRQAVLSWGGPVTVDQTFRLWLVPPWLTRLLEWLSIVLIVLVAARWIEVKRGRIRAMGKGAAATGGAAMLAAFALTGLLTATPSQVRADDADGDGVEDVQEEPASEPAPPPSDDGAPKPSAPSSGILRELRDRLTAPPDCLPDCAAFARMGATVTDDRLVVRLVADAAIATALPLPLPPVMAGSEGRTWQPQAVLLDERPAALLRDDGGRLWVRLEPGRHTVAITGSLAGFSQLQIPFPVAPHRVEVNAPGWAVAGIDANGQPGAALDFSRERAVTLAADSGRDAPQQVLAPLLVLTRTLRMGLVWSVDSTLERLSGASGAYVASVGLLPGETVTGDAVRVVDGHVQASFAPGQQAVEWTGRVLAAPDLALAAAASSDVFEVWRFDVSPIWHVEFEGLPPVQHEEGDWRLTSFRPWPGETLHAKLVRPEGVKGRVLTLDRATLEVKPGKRATDHTLTLRLRASQGGQHAIPLPNGLALQSVTIDGQVQPARREGARVIVPLHPGTQDVALALRGEDGLGTRLVTPALALGLPGVNADVVVQMPADRWILLAGGPRLGPAVLFWGVLLVLLVIAVGLARSGITPLKSVSWTLLMIGLSQIPIWAAAIVAGWLFALAMRGRTTESWSSGRFNAAQVLLGLWTLAALGALFAAVAQGLLGQPDMQIAGNGSSSYELRWYRDRFDGTMPSAWVVSVSIWWYRGLMLAWALWLANSLLSWLRWGWAQYTAGGLWRKAEIDRVAAPPAATGEAPTSLQTGSPPESGHQ